MHLSIPSKRGGEGRYGRPPHFLEGQLSIGILRSLQECDQGRVPVPEDVEKCVKSVYVMKI